MALDRQLRTLVKDRVDRTLVGRRDAAARARMFASILVVLVALGWWAVSGGATRGRIYNPGHVSRAHAMLEHDCNACHAGGDASPGGTTAAGGNLTDHFRRPVSDTACLACHDGAIHHDEQKVAETPAGVSRASLVLAVKDASRGTASPARAADCASCHVEHRGDDLIGGRDDEHCTVCHANLPAATRSGTTKLAVSVSAFTKDHPAFGRRLVAVDPVTNEQRPIDPTALKFNHRKHLADVPALQGGRSCATCHEFADDAPGTPTIEAALVRSDDPRHAPPPFAPATFATTARSASPCPATARPDGRYTLPVSYERHCAGCHQINVPPTMPPDVPKNEDGEEDKEKASYAEPRLAGLIAPHAPAARVRDFVEARVRELLARPDEQFHVRQAGAENSTRAGWMAANAEYLARTLPFELPARDGADPLQSNDVAHLVDRLTLGTLNAGGECLKCHVAAADASAATATSEATLSLQTVATGISKDAPRRWFPASEFDHRAHRDMSCVECHTSFSADNLARVDKLDPAAPGAATARRDVEDTSFVHSPNFTWRVTPADGAASPTRSCAECHHPDAGDDRGAGAACATCHTFHDRARERDVRAASLATTRATTAPVAAEALSVVATSP